MGINRPDSGKRSAPSTVNWQEADLYVSTNQRMYLCDPKGNALIPVVLGDIRALTYTQVDRFMDAPLNFVYVAGFQKMGDRKEEDEMMLASMDTGFIAQNVYDLLRFREFAHRISRSYRSGKNGSSHEIEANPKDNGR